MLQQLLETFRRWRASRRMARETGPRAFLEMSAELQRMAEAASKLWQMEAEDQARAHRILADAAQVQALAARPEFKRLSLEKRLELRRGLIVSRRQLLESMRQAAPPTGALQ
jgi:hypothetical protein